jgi:hypothetical protein
MLDFNINFNAKNKVRKIKHQTSSIINLSDILCLNFIIYQKIFQTFENIIQRYFLSLNNNEEFMELFYNIMLSCFCKKSINHN